MIALRPTDLPGIRDEVAEHVLRTGPATYERAIVDGRQFVRPLAPPAQAARILATSEVRRLMEAELFFVSADMTDLAVAAAATLPSFSLMPEDLPVPSGLMVFAKPIATVDYGKYYPNDSQSPIVGVCWSHWTGGDPRWVHGGVWATFYADRDGIADSASTRGIYDEAQAATVRAELPRLLIDNEGQSPFTTTALPIYDGETERDFKDGAGTVAAWMGVVKTAWLLMMQPIATVEDAVFNRAARRRMARLDQEPARVRVINLRRPISGHTGQSDREYHHQWIVRGHWRQQWYPTREVHRPVWIAPHIKGPEGLPLLGGEKVYAWTR